MLKIVTNNHPRPLLTWIELTITERKEFDYIDVNDHDEVYHPRFVRAYGNVYDIDDFEHINPSNPLKGWGGFISESFWDGIVVKYAKPFDKYQSDYDFVVIGRYYDDGER